jgi:hypothetical protein
MEYLLEGANGKQACRQDNTKRRGSPERRNRGSVDPAAARWISFEDFLRFQQVHEETYRRYGFTPIYFEPGGLPNRVSRIHEARREIPGQAR